MFIKLLIIIDIFYYRYWYFFYDRLLKKICMLNVCKKRFLDYYFCYYKIEFVIVISFFIG